MHELEQDIRSTGFSVKGEEHNRMQYDYFGFWECPQDMDVAQASGVGRRTANLLLVVFGIVVDTCEEAFPADYLTKMRIPKNRV